MPYPLADRYLGDAGDFLLINNFARHTGWLHGTMSFYAKDGVALFAVLIIAGWWLARRRSDSSQLAAVAWAALGTLAAVAINQPIVNAVHEARPYTAIPDVLVLISRSTDYGFPSDHATMAGAVATGLLYVDRKLGILSWCAAVLLAFSRIYVGAHYPHDVAAGLALGAAVILIGRVVAQPALTAAVTTLARTRLRPALMIAAPASEQGARNPG
ncbi:MAG: phosphatase PAP2 family protein [Actinomycetota bacterium]